MTCALYAGTVVHQRFKPRRHRLRYRLFWMLFDLDEIPPARLRLFSHNRFNLVSFYDRDHLNGTRSRDIAVASVTAASVNPGEGRGPTTCPRGNGTIAGNQTTPTASPQGLRPQIEQAMKAAGLVPDGGPIRLLCMPRVFGHAFNPISVFFCHRRDETLAAILYEVNNTFGQRHSYLIPVEDCGQKSITQHCDKAFYVSPFMDMAITYQFRVVPPADRTAVIVNGDDAHGRVIAASFTGRRRPLSDTALLGVVARHGLLSLKVIGAIHWEALKLWLKGVRLQPRPPPPRHPITIVSTQQG